MRPSRRPLVIELPQGVTRRALEELRIGRRIQVTPPAVNSPWQQLDKSEGGRPMPIRFRVAAGLPLDLRFQRGLAGTDAEKRP